MMTKYIKQNYDCVFTYIYSRLTEKDICDCRNVPVKLPHVYLCLSLEELFIFLVTVSSFYYQFCVIRISELSIYLYIPIGGSFTSVFLCGRKVNSQNVDCITVGTFLHKIIIKLTYICLKFIADFVRKTT